MPNDDSAHRWRPIRNFRITSWRCGAPAPGWAGFLFLGSLALNSKMLSRANHGHRSGTNMTARSIPHALVAITMLR